MRHEARRTLAAKVGMSAITIERPDRRCFAAMDKYLDRSTFSFL
jgi:hypothetical protein